MSKTQFIPFSAKQLKVLCWWCDKSEFKNRDAIICDGAVRSGKTLCMSISFVLWAFYRFEDTSFAICGKTIASLKRNVVTPLLPLLCELGFVCQHKVSKNVIEISKNGVTNRFYIFGGKDESSASLIDKNIHITSEERVLWNTQCVEGTYFGSGGTQVEVILGFKPKAVIVFSYNKPLGLANATDCYAGISTQFINSIGIDLTPTGFKTYHGTTHSVDGIIPKFNVAGMDYAYLAFK